MPEVKVYQYTRGMMHSKVIIVDGEWASVGLRQPRHAQPSPEFRSELPHPLREVAARLEQNFMEDLDVSIRLRPPDISRASPGRAFDRQRLSPHVPDSLIKASTVHEQSRSARLLTGLRRDSEMCSIERANLNTGSFGPLSRPVFEKVHRLRQRLGATDDFLEDRLESGPNDPVFRLATLGSAAFPMRLSPVNSLRGFEIVHERLKP